MRAWIFVALLCASSALAKAPTSLAEDPQAKSALKAYNAGKYKKASGLFLELVQRWPEEPAPYRALARAWVWANNAKGAVRAYRIYQKLAPDASDHGKIDAELRQALRKLGGKGPTARPPAKAAKTLKKAVEQAKAGVFVGAEGAFSLLDVALGQGYLGPDLSAARTTIRSALAETSELTIDDWWKPEVQALPEALSHLVDAWAELADRSALLPGEEPLPQALEGLMALAGDDAPRALELLTPVAPGDTRLTYAQVIALIRTEQFDDAESLLDSLVQVESDPRVQIMLGLVQNKLGRPSAVTALRAGLLEE